MHSALMVPQVEAVWFQGNNYRIVPLNPSLNQASRMLDAAIQQGVWMNPDPNRPEFYDVQLTTGCAYIHVRHRTRNVYVVGYRQLS